MKYLKANGRSVASFVNLACSGDVTDNFLNPRHLDKDEPKIAGSCQSSSADEILTPLTTGPWCDVSLRPQVDGISSSTDVVLLTYGGNDVGFADIVKECFFYMHPGRCQSRVQAANAMLNDGTLKTRLVNNVFRPMKLKLKANASARIVMLGYPSLMSSSYGLTIKDGSVSYDAGKAVRDLQMLGVKVQQDAANEANTIPGAPVQYVSAIPDWPNRNQYSFAGHEPDPRRGSSNSSRWLLEFFETTISIPTWYHPNPRGHQAYRDLLINTAGVGKLDQVVTPIPEPNRLPTASFTYSRLNGANNLVSLDGRSSSDPDGYIKTWEWKVNGVTVATGPSPAVVPLGAGTSKDVTLTVTDDRSGQSSVTHTVLLPNRPPLISSLSPSNSVVASNQPTLRATASDPDADPLSFRFHVTGPAVDIASDWVGSSWTVPAHLLDPGTRYQWTVQAIDGRGGASVIASSSFTVAMLPTAADVVATSTGRGYWQVASDGGVFSYGDAQFFGSVPGLGLKLTNITGMVRTPDSGGYWLVGTDGGVFSFGNAPFFGSLPALNVRVNNIVGMAATKTGRGYWLVGSDGGVFAFGDAGFYGSMGGRPLNKPVVGLSPTASGLGYWLAAGDGGIFAFGDAQFYGSLGGIVLNYPVVDLDVTPDGGGYWMTAEDGGVFAFGDAAFFGSLAGHPLNGHIDGMSVTASGGGYWLTGCDGGVFTFGDAPFLGSNPTYQCRGVA